MATAGDGTAPYQGGGGAGGKFRKRPFRRSIPATPYARPPSAVKNDNPSMLKKLVDPASRLISAGAHRLFDVFRNRLNPRSLGPPEINEEPQIVLQNDGGNGNSASTSAATGISDLEQLLQQKTFTRSEIKRLTSVLHSKATESPSDDSPEKQGDKRDNSHAAISTPMITSGVLKETSSPAELAKYYMGSRSTSQAPRQDPKLHSRTPITTVAQKTANSFGNLENGFATPRSRGRSALYTMARTPYSRSPSTFSQQGIKSDYGHDTALTSSQGHEGKMALKRRSSVLDDDIGSGGPLRRIRQKANLLSQREKKELGYTAFQQPDASGQNLLLTNEPEPNVSNYALVPIKATQTANKILQHLDKPSSIEKTSPSTFAGTKEKTPNKLRLDMLHGQALRSLEKVDSPKLDPVVHNIRKPVVSELTFQSKDKTEENVSRKSSVPHNMLTSVNGDVADTSKNKAAVVEVTNLPSKVTEEPQRKHAFQMSAPEDMFEIDDDDDDVHDNGHVPLSLVENNKPKTSAADIIKTPTLLEVSKTPDLVEHNKSVISGVSKVPEQVELKEDKNDKSTTSTKAEFGFSVGGEQGLGFKSPISSPSSPSVTTTQTSVLASANSTSQMGKDAPVKVSPFSFSANEPSEFKSNAGSVPKEIVPISVFNSVTKNDNAKDSVSNKDENGTLNGNDQKLTNMFGKSESSFPGVSAATSADGISSLGTSNKNMSTPDTTPASNPPAFPSLAPFSASASTATTTTTMAGLSTTTTTPAVSFSTVSPQVFSFGSATSTTPSTSVAETGNTNSSSPFAITTFATTATAVPATTGSGLFGFSSPAAATSTTTAANGSSLFGISSSATSTSITTTATGSGLFGFSSAAAGTSTTTTTTTGNGLFGFSSPAAATSTTPTTGGGVFGFSSSEAATSTAASATTTTTTSSGLFGFSSPTAATSTTTTPNPATGSGLFGFNPSAANTSTTTPTTGSGLFSFSSPSAATSTAATTTGSGVFGFSSAAATATTATTSGSGLFGFSSPAAPTSTTTTTTGSGVFGFNSPAAATSTTTTTTGSGLFTFGSTTAANSTASSQSQGSFFNVTNGFQASTNASSTPSLFGSSAPAFGSTPNSGNSTSGSTTSVFGSSWQQPQQSSGFGSTFTSSPSTSVFSFGASPTPTPSFGGPSVFGNSTPVFGAAAAASPINISNNNNNDQMSMEDSMAEDSMQTHSPVTPVSPFGQAPVTTPGFMFGSTTPNPTPGPVSFSFGGQPNQAPPPQNPFQSSSVEFNAGGGSFSLGSGGEKSNRRIVRVMKSKNRKK